MISVQQWFKRKVALPLGAALAALLLLDSVFLFQAFKDAETHRAAAAKQIAELSEIAISQNNRHLIESLLEISRWQIGSTSSSLCKNNMPVVTSGDLVDPCRESSKGFYRTIDKPLSGYSEYRLVFVAPVFSFSSSVLVLSGISIFFLALLVGLVSYSFSEFLKNILGPLKNGLLDSKELPIQEMEAIRLSLMDTQQLRTREAVSQAMAEAASQVAHDIRSPLAALEMVLKDVSNLPEEQRSLVRIATSRIRDIANGLLNVENGTVAGAERPSPQLLSALIELILTEKRMQYRALSGIGIDSKIDSRAFGLFAVVSPSDFKRVVSNLVNNAVEAMKTGHVSVSAHRDHESVVVEVQDNGKGISHDVLAKLGKEKVTCGKEGAESGSGLGVLHARQCVESWGGKLEIRSEQGKGTTLTMRIPLADQPSWFPSDIRIQPGEKIIVLDDDLSILRVWEGRFSSVGIRHFAHFSSAENFDAWYAAEGKDGHFRFLFDYELIGSSQTGLDLIEKYQLAQNSILVTSRFEEKNIRDRADRLKVKLLPKGLAAFVPIVIESQGTVPALDAVFLDDDEMMRKSWEFAATKRKMRLLCCATSSELFGKLSEIGKGTPIYIDSNLERESLKGEAVAKVLHEKGYINLFLATGYSPNRFQDMPWIKGIVGKEAPWV